MTIVEETAMQPVNNHCFRLTGNWALADDATSAVFFAAWRQRGDVKLVHDSASPNAWTTSSG
ncbi:RNA polymerase sigma factor [Cryptosporangium sp. NPDC048952]|uniref:RNA polymerase sigma factor n=1 Tax=Cryptosporangium sp. NPDC048952 TaxID=3363961 RepID=UPI003710C333